MKTLKTLTEELTEEFDNTTINADIIRKILDIGYNKGLTQGHDNGYIKGHYSGYEKGKNSLKK